MTRKYRSYNQTKTHKKRGGTANPPQVSNLHINNPKPINIEEVKKETIPTANLPANTTAVQSINATKDTISNANNKIKTELTKINNNDSSRTAKQIQSDAVEAASNIAAIIAATGTAVITTMVTTSAETFADAVKIASDKLLKKGSDIIEKAVGVSEEEFKKLVSEEKAIAEKALQTEFEILVDILSMVTEDYPFSVVTNSADLIFSAMEASNIPMEAIQEMTDKYRAAKDKQQMQLNNKTSVGGGSVKSTNNISKELHKYKVGGMRSQRRINNTKKAFLKPISSLKQTLKRYRKYYH